MSLRKQRSCCAGLAITVCPDNNKLALSEAFGLKPSLSPSAALGGTCKF